MVIHRAYLIALQDFGRARRRANLQKILRVFGENPQLLSYVDVRHQLRAIEKPNTDLREIPIDAIRGSVNRYDDFTYDFLPTDSVDPQRWARVKSLLSSPEGLPPIDVYQIGEMYFVIDGNHRVSVAREMGFKSIQAYVRPVSTKVHIEQDENIDQILIKAELAEFFEYTNFDVQYPEVNLSVTAPGRYLFIMQQVEAIHFSLELNQNRKVPYPDALKHWFDTVYKPIIEIIRTQELLDDFPDRTETDLFLWIFKHRATLAKSLGWDISPEKAAQDISEKTSTTIEKFRDQSAKIFQKLLHPRQPQTPPPGLWRSEKMAALQGRLFQNILVFIDDLDHNVEFFQSARIAQLEGSQLYGLYMASTDIPLTKQEETGLSESFNTQCKDAGITGQLAFESGNKGDLLIERSCWADLVITAPHTGLSLLRLIQGCTNPILIARNPKPLGNAVLVYGENQFADEALFLSAYLRTFWELSLEVFILPGTPEERMRYLRDYLAYYRVPATIDQLDAAPIESLIESISDHHCDLVIMGGLGNEKSLNDQILGSLVGDNHKKNLLVCH